MASSPASWQVRGTAGWKLDKGNIGEVLGDHTVDLGHLICREECWRGGGGAEHVSMTGVEEWSGLAMRL